LRYGAYAAELFACMASLLFVYSQSASMAALLSISSLAVLLLSTGVRRYAKCAESYSERYRIMSLRAVINGRDICLFDESRAEEDCPWLISWIPVKKTLAIEDYYAPKCQAGIPRMRELYAQNSFWTWNLLRNVFRSCACAAGVVLILTICILCYLAQTSFAGGARDVVVKILMSIGVALIAIRLTDLAIASGLSYFAIRQTHDRMLDCTTEDKEKVQSLAAEYDKLILNAPLIPTLVYWISKNRLEEQWKKKNGG
jgi:hypothetical protein